jgi:hypothetical protein
MTEQVRAISTATPGAAPVSIETRMTFTGTRADVWKRIVFYEQLEHPPPLHLRLLLPIPIETIGDKSRVGDEARCRYQRGYLIKRVTGVEVESSYVFDVVEQALDVGNGMKLVGGSYVLRALDDGRTEVALTTRYSSPRSPRWLWKPIEAAVCHSFHRHILREMRRSMEHVA